MADDELVPMPQKSALYSLSTCTEKKRKSKVT